MTGPLPEDMQVPEALHVYHVMAAEAFKGIALALERQDAGDVERITTTYMGMFKDTHENPLEHLTRVAIVQDALIMRMSAGDPDPTGPPTGELTGSVLAFRDDESGQQLIAPVMEFAVEIIAYAANWKFAEVEESMAQKVNEENKDNSEFLLQFVYTLMNIFLSMDGPERLGWK